MRCDQCQQIRINGVACHEAGCPNSNKQWDSGREQWVAYRDCFECGYPVEVGETCDCQLIDLDAWEPEEEEEPATMRELAQSLVDFLESAEDSKTFDARGLVAISQEIALEAVLIESRGRIDA
jgi:hypothetical protein